MILKREKGSRLISSEMSDNLGKVIHEGSTDALSLSNDVIVITLDTSVFKMINFAVVNQRVQKIDYSDPLNPFLIPDEYEDFSRTITLTIDPEGLRGYVLVDPYGMFDASVYADKVVLNYTDAVLTSTDLWAVDFFKQINAGDLKLSVYSNDNNLKIETNVPKVP